MSPVLKAIAAVALLAVGLVMLAFTACGLVFGVSVLLHDGLWASLIGFVCAIVGASGLLPIYRGLKDLWPWRKATAPQPSATAADEHLDSK